MNVNTLDKLLGALPETIDTEPDDSNPNYLLAQAFMDYYQEWNDALDRVAGARFDQTATGAALDARLAYVGFSAAGNALTDAEKRTLLAQRKAKLWGASTYGEMLGLVVALTGMDGAQVVVRENKAPYPSTAYEPAAIEFLVTSQALIAAGVPAGSIASVLSRLQSDLTLAAPAGVRVGIILTTGAVYGTSVYDQPGSVYAT